MAQSRVALAAVLGTVTDTANAVSSVVNTLSGAVGMANRFVQHQSEKQRFDQSIDLDEHRIRKIEELSVNEADRKKKISDLCKDPEQAEYYNAAYQRLSKHLPQQESA